MVFETRRTIIAQRCREEITIFIRIVRTTEEAHEIVLCLVVVGRKIVDRSFACSNESLCHLFSLQSSVVRIGSRIFAPRQGMLTSPEVLPFVTSHHVKVVTIVEILIVLSISIEREIALQNLIPAVVAIIVSLTTIL